MKNSTNLLIIDGGTVKTEAEGIVTGMGIVFGSEKDPDQSSMRDFFTNESFITKRQSFSVPLYYEHGLGLIDEEIGEAVLTKSQDGWDALASIDVSTEAGKKIYERVKEKKHGFSTGAVAHLVKREAKANNTNFLKKWPVGELSLTERPAERKAVVQSVKSVDGEVIKEEWNSIERENSVTIAIYDEDGVEIWNIESGLPLPTEAKTIEVKYDSGSVSYNIYTYNEDTERSIDITAYEYGGAEDFINTLQNLINQAALGIKAQKVPDNEKDFETRVLEIMKSKWEEQFKDKGVKEDVDLVKEADGLQELADLKTQLSDREEALTKANEKIARLEILAGAKETINKLKGNENEK